MKPTSIQQGTENSPLLILQSNHDPHQDTDAKQTFQDRKILRQQLLLLLCFSTVLVLMADLFKNYYHDVRSIHLLRSSIFMQESNPSESDKKESYNNSKSKYKKVQTLSFNIYTGGAPAFFIDEETGERKQNSECIGLNSYGLPEDAQEDDLKCYLGLEDTTMDIHRRLTIMVDAVDRAYDVSNKDDSVLKIFLAPEFFFRGLNGAFQFHANESRGECSEICHILQSLENIVANKRFENWLFLFGTIIASEALPTEDSFDYQFYNFAPLYKGYDPATSNGNGKNFIVPKRYVSNIDFLTPMRDLTNQTLVMELLDLNEQQEQDQKQQQQQQQQQQADQTLMNPHARGIKRYGNDVWVEYKDELASLGYTMIEYGWFNMDNINFSVEICLDHLVHRALMTYMADVVTGSKTRIPSSANDVLEWVGIPRHQAQISLVSSAGMGVVVSSLVLRNGGYIFLQDGMEGDLTPHSTFGQNECQPNELEFYGGSQCVRRTAVVSSTDVTFEYEMNHSFEDYYLYPDTGESRHWRHKLKGVFSRTAYPPRITVYDPVSITSV